MFQAYIYVENEMTAGLCVDPLYSHFLSQDEYTYHTKWLCSMQATTYTLSVSVNRSLHVMYVVPHKRRL